MTTPTAERPAGPDAANVAATAAGVLGAALTLGALAVFGSRAALSVAAGATIAVANLVTMSAIVRAMLRPAEDEADTNAPKDGEGDARAEAPNTEERPQADHKAEGKRGGAAWGAFAVVKILVLFGGVWLLLTRGMVDPIPLVVGYGVLPLGITVGGLLTSLAPRRARRGRKK